MYRLTTYNRCNHAMFLDFEVVEVVVAGRRLYFQRIYLAVVGETERKRRR